MDTDHLQGKVVVVTGATGRLGGRVLDRFARHGAVVAAVARDAAEVALPRGAQGRAFSADVTREADVAACFGQVTDAFGPPDALVHTVGTWDGRPFLDTSLDDWDRLVRLNLTSTFLCFREAARRMTGRPGRLIGIASGQGADKGRAQQGAYSASKAGLVRLVEAVAEEFAGTGVTAHAIAPSTILFDEGGGQAGVAVSALVDLAVYLCTPAGAALNGATLRAYGNAR